MFLRKSLIALTVLLFLSACAVGGEQTPDSTLTVGLDDDPPQLDPHRSSAAVDRQVFQSLYNKLVDIDEDLNIIPELAREWDISDDGLVYTFYLEEDVVFHDGEMFDAEAVKYNFERMLDPDFPSARTSEVGMISKVETVDDYTVEITLEDVYAPFLSALTDRAGMMVSPAAAEELGDSFQNQPVGTGPFSYVNRVRDSHITLERFEDFWRESPEFQEVVFRPFADEQVRTTNLVSGDVDILSKMAWRDIELLGNNPDITLEQGDSLGFQGIHLNNTVAPFDNKYVRQAVNVAIDRQAIVDVAFYGGALPSISGVAPASSMYTEFIDIPEPNPEKARELLEQSGIDDVEFTLSIAPSPTEEQIAEMIQAMLGEVGINVHIEMVEFGQLLEQLDIGNFQAVRNGWSGRMDPDGNLNRFFHSEGSNNYMRFENEHMDELLEEASQVQDEEIRTELYEEVNKIAWEESPYIFLYHEVDFKAMKEEIEGFPHIGDSMIRTEKMYRD